MTGGALRASPPGVSHHLADHRPRHLKHCANLLMQTRLDSSIRTVCVVIGRRAPLDQVRKGEAARFINSRHQMLKIVLLAMCGWML